MLLVDCALQILEYPEAIIVLYFSVFATHIQLLSPPIIAFAFPCAPQLSILLLKPPITALF